MEIDKNKKEKHLYNEVEMLSSMVVKPRVSPYCDQIGKYSTYKWLVNLSYIALLLIALILIFVWALPLWLSLIPMGLLAIVGLTYIFISTRRCDQNVNE